jgi:hypothetical protein
MPIEAKSGNHTSQRTDESRKKVGNFHKILSTALGAFIGTVIGLFGFCLVIGHLEYIFSRKWLKRCRVSKCLYYDPNDYS